MDIYVYADESGVFYHLNNEFYVYGGTIFLSKQDRDIANRKYLHVERTIRKHNPYYREKELKASLVSNKHKGDLFRSLNNTIKFGVVIRQELVNEGIFDHKKSKQRYLDYAFKIGIKRAFENLINAQAIVPEEVYNIHINVDEHTTATNGRYELREGLEEEFKNGTINYKWNKIYPPLFTNLKSLNVCYCNSSKQALIRASDVVANRLYYHANKSKLYNLENKVHIVYLP